MSLPHVASILVVEDSDEDFETLTEGLRRSGLGMTVHRVMSGEEALAALRAARYLSLVILDLNIPGIDGRELLRELRADTLTALVPLVVLSASNNPRDVEQCYLYGANAYHVKPIRHDEHLDVITAMASYWLTCATLPEARTANA